MKVHPLKYERELRGWSQAKVAKAIGTTSRTVHRWEHGQGVPYPYYREKLCALFGKNTEELGLLPEKNLESMDRASSPSSLPSSSEFVQPIPSLYDPAILAAPAGESALIGRDVLLTELKQQLLAHKNWALYGLPGIGKTALAAALAADPEIQHRFHDGILWVGLGTEPNVLSLLSHWATLLGISLTHVENVSNWESWGMAVHAAIGTRCMLIVIDDAWKAEEALAFQIGGPNCAHLVTTRLPHIAVTFSGPGVVEVPQLEETDGFALLARFAPEITTQETESAYALVRSVGALPLALTLIGKYLGSQACTRQPRRLHMAITQLQDAQQRLLLSVPASLLERSPSLSPGTPLSLHATIEVSERLVSEQARFALRALSVFPAKPNSFSEALALAVTGEGTHVLDELCDAGLLECSWSDRYMLHQTIADYAKQSLTGTDAYKDVYKRWILVSVNYVETYQNDYEQLDLEVNNLLAAFDASYQLEQHQEAIRGVCAFAPFLQARGLHTVAREYLQQAYSVAKPLRDPSYIVTISSFLGEIASILGANAQAEEYLRDGLALASEHGDQVHLCRLLSSLSFLAIMRGHPAQAKAYAEEGLTIARLLGHRKPIVDLLTWLGWAAYDQQDYTLADTYYQEALPRARQINDQQALCRVLIGQGWLATALGNYAQAEAFYQEGTTIAHQLQHRFCLCLLRIGQGWLSGRQGNYAEAEAATQEALELARRMHAYELTYRSLTSLGWLAEKRGAYTEADTYYQEALILVRRHERPQLLCMVLFHLGKLRLKQQQFEAAAAFFQEMFNRVPEGDQNLIARAQSGLKQVTLIQSHQAEKRDDSPRLKADTYTQS
ncbi:helix-turn-helix domain-containing protein [Ktedonobacter racemifer]|uniref:Transcriptional regulator, XRE family n=1 Tax=Ktedonobacter racemifer DSM 44963 TaxID=485913 RepID=D6TCI4_KTERA|nr:helix-turn-helix domain-containing protein [Ktedonobacter racemifer]EFH90001.1 transcriptional regulator, XRE family [Ktedonobacter racemifer DSM 44963]